MTIEIDFWWIMGFLAMAYVLFAGLMLWALRMQRMRRQQQREDQEQTLESKLRLLSQTSSRAVELSKQVTVEIDGLSEAARKARAEAEEAQAAASLSAEARDAVATLVRKELRTSDRRGIWTNVILSAVFFALGVGASIIVNMTVGPAEAPTDDETASISQIAVVSEY